MDAMESFNIQGIVVSHSRQCSSKETPKNSSVLKGLGRVQAINYTRRQEAKRGKIGEAMDESCPFDTLRTSMQHPTTMREKAQIFTRSGSMHSRATSISRARSTDWSLLRFIESERTVKAALMVDTRDSSIVCRNNKCCTVQISIFWRFSSAASISFLMYARKIK